MARKVVYWGSTGLVCLSLLAALSYLTGSEQVVSGFAKAGYPQHLRIVLGIAKPVAAIVLLIPGFTLLKEWAYAGIFFNMTGAAATGVFVGAAPWHVIVDLVLTALTVASWALRPPSRRLEGGFYKFGEEAS